LRKTGDQVQYGGPHLCADWRFGTTDGKAHFLPVPLPATEVPEGMFAVATRRGKQFNSMVAAEVDPLLGAARDSVLMAVEDAARLKLDAGDLVIVRNDLGEYRGRVVIDRVKPGSVQVYWPEANALLPAGRLDPSGVPDYNATVEIIPACT
jgi:anaerobic selenocysteine-containing dehydrogenase